MPYCLRFYFAIRLILSVFSSVFFIFSMSVALSFSFLIFSAEVNATARHFHDMSQYNGRISYDAVAFSQSSLQSSSQTPSLQPIHPHGEGVGRESSAFDTIPDILKPWIGWVLHGHEAALWCIPRYDDNHQMTCLWPSRLDLNLDSKGGMFSQVWHVAYGNRIPLPGSEKLWPMDVEIDGIPAIVVSHQGKPAASIHWDDPGDRSSIGFGALEGRYLDADQGGGFGALEGRDFDADQGRGFDTEQGRALMDDIPIQSNVRTVRKMTVTGRWRWKERPEFIQIPKRSALLGLRVDGETIPFPNLDSSGRIWLKRSRAEKREKKEEDRLKIEAFRLIDDTIPAVATLHLSLDASGSSREILLGPVFPHDAFIPLSLESPLPARLASDGMLRIQVKPGQYEIVAMLRHIGPLQRLGFDGMNPGAAIPPGVDGSLGTQDTLHHWPDHEIWAFKRHSDLRIVEITGGVPVDPRRTNLPKAWHTYPAFKMVPGRELGFKEIKRGDPQPAPDHLTLERILWLHFDGSGYTVQDTITGKKNSDWRLEMDPAMTPGKVSVDGKEQLITRQKESDSPGVELRKGVLNLTSEGRFMGSVRHVPATGWLHEFQKVNGKFLLPPGWKLIHAAGVDHIPHTWVKKWSLLDFFIVLIFTVATARLYNRPLSIIGFTTLVLTWHEPLAPRYIWLYLLGGFAMLRYLPAMGKLRKMAQSYQTVTALLLLLVTVPYAVQALRVGMFPQLERPWISMNDQIGQGAGKNKMDRTNRSGLIDGMAAMDEAQPMMQQEAPAPKEGYMTRAIPLAKKVASSRMPGVGSETMPSGSGYYGSDMGRLSVMQQDPKALTQTGPGLPVWQPFTTVSFGWSGPVAPGQTIDFYLIGPFANTLLAFVRVGLILILAAGLFGAGFKKNEGFIGPRLTAFAALFPLGVPLGSFLSTWGKIMALWVMVSIAGGGATAYTQAGEIPSPEMLRELETRIFEPADCFPHCADLSEITIDIDSNHLSLILRFHADIDTAVPLPGDARYWLPSHLILNRSGWSSATLGHENSVSVSTVNEHGGRSATPDHRNNVSISTVKDQETPLLFREEETLWMMLPEGHHTLRMEGPIHSGAEGFQLPLPMPPRHGHAKTNGWEIQGIESDGTMASQLQFKRLALKDDTSFEQADKHGTGAEEERNSGETRLESGILPAFARVERHLMIGLVWKVETRVIRTTPSDAAMMLSIPLLPNESVTTQDVRVIDGNVAVNMAAGLNRFSWESFLEPSERIVLTHADTTAWTEVWTADISPVFHVETEGIPVILHQMNHRWYPTWHPWPGERVSLLVSRPAAVPGNTLTIESSRLLLRPGRRASSAVLTLEMKSSQGGQHTIRIPEGAELQEVRVNDAVQLIRQDGQNVPLPIDPGSQTVQLTWRGSSKYAMGMIFTTPEIDLGISSVNGAVDLHLPKDRWPLLLGGEPLVGPAILFWSVIIVVLLAALALSRSGLSPLRFHHWALLGIGISMSSLPAAICIAAWLIFMDLRKKAGALAEGWHGPESSDQSAERASQSSQSSQFSQSSLHGISHDPSQHAKQAMPQEEIGRADPIDMKKERAKRFNLIQIALAGLTLLSGASLIMAISQGLIGHPDMNITGNGSSAGLLRWYQDICDPVLPKAWVFSLPMLVYRVAMLAWALWIAFALLNILKWGWQRYSQPLMWISIPRPPKKRFQWRRAFGSKNEEKGGDKR